MSNDKKVSGTAAQMGMRADAGPFCRALITAAQQRPEIVALSADLSKYTDLNAFAETFPERFLNVGMAEQNLVLVAAGMAQAGLVPVATTFAAFMTRRATDFTVMQVALPKANVKLIGAVPGVSSSFGPSHTSIDDLAAMRAIPHMTVIDPCDNIELAEALTAALDHDGPVYLRQQFAAHGAPVTAPEPRQPFRIGSSQLMRKGSDIGIIASGFLVGEALKAAELLQQAGIDAAVLNVPTLKPFDGDGVLELAATTRTLVTAENHSVIGGLFSAVAETLARAGCPARVHPIGVPDRFPDFGSRDYLAAQLGMNAAAIAAAAKGLAG
jgi:transketolase